MPKQKKKQGGVQFDKLPAHEIPSKSCKDFLTHVIANFYETNDLLSLVSKYVRYQEEGPMMFKQDLTQLMMQALATPTWVKETDKRGFLNWLDNRMHYGIKRQYWTST